MSSRVFGAAVGDEVGSALGVAVGAGVAVAMACHHGVGVGVALLADIASASLSTDDPQDTRKNIEAKRKLFIGASKRE